MKHQKKKVRETKVAASCASQEKKKGVNLRCAWLQRVSRLAIEPGMPAPAR